MMQKIHDYMIAPPDLALSVCGTQEYEAKVVILEQTGKSFFVFTFPVFKAWRKMNFNNTFYIVVWPLLRVPWTRRKREQQSARPVCTSSQEVQRRPAHQRHPANDGCLSLSGRILHGKGPVGHWWYRCLPDKTFPWWENQNVHRTVNMDMDYLFICTNHCTAFCIQFPDY